MRRRTLLTVGLVSGTLLALAGGTLALLRPGRRDGRLSDSGRAVFAALLPAVLPGLLPVEAAAREAALAAHLQRVEDAIAGLSPALQAEVDELLTVVGSAPGRLLLAGLTPDWGAASADEVRAALQTMRNSSITLRQQAFHALRTLTNASWFSDASTWVAIGYPGQMRVGS